MFAKHFHGITLIILVSIALGLSTSYISASPQLQGDQPVRTDEVITVATDLEPNSLDPLFGDAPGGPDRYTYNLLYDTLIRLESDGSYTPMLAEDYTISEDGLVITFDIREGVIFHDGTEFNADAAAFNLNRAIDPETNAPRGPDLADIASIEATDDNMLIVTLKEPSAVVLTMLSLEAGMMVSPTALETQGEDFGRNPVGTGSFKFVEWRGDDRIIVERNEDYWRTDEFGTQLPYVGGVVIRFISETPVKLIELQSGNVLLTDVISPLDFETVEEDEDLQLVYSPSGIHQWMTFNVTQPPFDNPALRKAILYGIDRQVLSDVITFGYGTVTPTLVPPSEWIFEPNLAGYSYDPDKAREYLEEAGYPDGIDFTISIIQRDPDTQIAQLVQAMLADVGMNVEVETLERQAWIDKVLAYDYEVAMLRVGVPRPDPDQVFGNTFGRNAANNWSGGVNEELYDIIDEARVTQDQAKRRELYVQAQGILLEDAFYGFLFFRPIAFPMSVRVQDFPMDVDGGWRLGELWVAE